MESILKITFQIIGKMNKINRIMRYSSTILLVLMGTIFIFLSLLQQAQAHSLIDGSISGTTNGHGRQHGQRLMQSSHNGNQNRCQQGWMWFNNKCWVTTQSRRDFNHAIELCKKMYNSTLPTIHSEDENEFLRQNIDLHNSPIWLYARHNHQYNSTRWMDKSPVNYTRWDAGQPSDKSSLICIKTEESWYMKKAEPVDGQTECVTFWEDAKWGTQVGCLVLLPVVCEKKLTPISRQADGPNGTISTHLDQALMYTVSGVGPSICFNSIKYLIPISYLITIWTTISLSLRRFDLNQKMLS